MKTNTLQKTSTNEDIKIYFQKIFDLKMSGEEFPVNLDFVYPLVYEHKKHAVNELLNTKSEDGSNRYLEGIDYQSLPQIVQAGHTNSKKIIYKLSVPCMEWFIARKIRPVFEVYRQVFHKVAETKQQELYNTDLNFKIYEVNKKVLRNDEQIEHFKKTINNLQTKVIEQQIQIETLLKEAGLPQKTQRLYPSCIEDEPVWDYCSGNIRCPFCFESVKINFSAK